MGLKLFSLRLDILSGISVAINQLPLSTSPVLQATSIYLANSTISSYAQRNQVSLFPIDLTRINSVAINQLAVSCYSLKSPSVLRQASTKLPRQRVFGKKNSSRYFVLLCSVNQPGVFYVSFFKPWRPVPQFLYSRFYVSFCKPWSPVPQILYSRFYIPAFMFHPVT